MYITYLNRRVCVARLGSDDGGVLNLSHSIDVSLLVGIAVKPLISCPGLTDAIVDIAGFRLHSTCQMNRRCATWLLLRIKCINSNSFHLYVCVGEYVHICIHVFTTSVHVCSYVYTMDYRTRNARAPANCIKHYVTTLIISYCKSTLDFMHERLEDLQNMNKAED